MIVQRKFAVFFLLITVVLILGFSSREHFSEVKRIGTDAVEYLKSKIQTDFNHASDISISADLKHPTQTANDDTVDILPPSVAAPETIPDLPPPEVDHDDDTNILPPSPTGLHTESDHASPTTSEPPSQAATTVTDNFGGDRWFFQDDLHDFENAEFDLGMKNYKAHNYEGDGHETYATFLSTRNSSLKDPYFLATQQMTYRLLWDDTSKSSHPVVVFVAPYISQIQRDYLSAAGAMVRELELVDWQPTHMTTATPRWREMFSKLNFWKQTDFSRILYLDTDAFPLTHLDELFDLAQEQTCREEFDEDLEACQYVFAAVEHQWGGLNAGLLLLKPDLAMHDRLMREMHVREEYDQNGVEQAFLDHEFGLDGPFPAQYLERKWNALFTTNEDEGQINVIHEKLWAMSSEHFAAHYFRETWDAMLKLYESEDFVKMRKADGVA